MAKEQTHHMTERALNPAQQSYIDMEDEYGAHNYHKKKNTLT